MKFIIFHAFKESCRRKSYYFVCLFACFLVSLVALISKTLSMQGSLIFLMLSERQKGEIDLLFRPIIQPRNSYSSNESMSHIEDLFIDSSFINYTHFNQIMSISSEQTAFLLQQSTSRLIIDGSLNNGTANIILYLIDSAKEKKLEIGRAFPNYNLSIGECIIHQNINRQISSAKELLMELNMTSFIRNTLLTLYYDNDDNENLVKSHPNITSLNKTNTIIKLPCKVKMVIKENYGKFNGDNDKTIIMEKEYFFKHMSKYLNKNITTFFPLYHHYINSISPDDYSNNLIINFPPNRINSYIENDYHSLIAKGVKYANSIVKYINMENLSVSMPLIALMEHYKLGSVILNIILNIIITALFILSLILIYSLMMITIETNSFEFGIMRLIGSNKRHLILMIIVQCITFAVPGFILAFGAHFIVLDILNEALSSLIQTNLRLSFSYQSLFISLIVNFLAPIFAAIIPLRTILKKNVSNSLNNVYNKTTGIKIEIISLKQTEINTMIIFGCMTFLYGASIYYFLPLSMISSNYAMLSFTFLWILLGIVIGCIVLSMNIENTLQRIVTSILMYFTKSYTKLLIIKNLAAHRLKNRKTSMMYSLSVGLFIMSTVALDIIIQSIQKDTLMRQGAEIVLSTSQDYAIPKHLRLSLMDMFTKGAIELFSYRSPQLKEMCKASTSVESLGTAYTFNMDLLGVSPSLFNISHQSTFLRIAENQHWKKDDYNTMIPTEQLYLKENIGKIGLSGIFTWEFNVHLYDDFTLRIWNILSDIMMSFTIKPAFIIDSAAGVNMNSEPSMMYQRASLISIPLYLDLKSKCYLNSGDNNTDYPQYDTYDIHKIYIKPTSLMPTEEALNIISSIISSDPNYLVRVWLFNNLHSRIQSISSMVYMIFNIISAVVLFFCFFNITASMTINIYDQKKEIAILRAMGMKASHIIFIFVLEAIVLILTSSIIGTAIGSFISYTMSLQWQIFTNISLTYSIDIGSVLIVILFSTLGGILSTIIPAYTIMKISISDLIRNA